VSLPIQRLRGDNLITLKEYLLAAVDRLSAELGYNPGETPSRVEFQAARSELTGQTRRTATLAGTAMR
jgi:hypothetical protein